MELPKNRAKYKAVVLTADKFEDMEVFFPVFRLLEKSFVCLYNLWELVNVILALVQKIDSKRPAVAAKLFGTILFTTFNIGGVGPPRPTVSKKPIIIQRTLNL